MNFILKDAHKNLAPNSSSRIFTVPTTCSRPSTKMSAFSFPFSVAGVLARAFESKS